MRATSDGRLDVDLDVPSEMSGKGGPGTNPEQLFAAGYAACFQSTLTRIAFGRKLDLTGPHVTARVGIGPSTRAASASRLHSTSTRLRSTTAKRST
jgi:osmotically inducible protein OsmC